MINEFQTVGFSFIDSFNCYCAQVSFLNSFQTISKAASFSSSRLLSVSMAIGKLVLGFRAVSQKNNFWKVKPRQILNLSGSLNALKILRWLCSTESLNKDNPVFSSYSIRVLYFNLSKFESSKSCFSNIKVFVCFHGKLRVVTEIFRYRTTASTTLSFTTTLSSVPFSEFHHFKISRFSRCQDFSRFKPFSFFWSKRR